jgi:hypothetical protein
MQGVRTAVKSFFSMLFLFGVMFFVFAPVQVSAQVDGLEEVGSSADLSEESLTSVIGKFIGIFLSVLGIIFLILILYAGFLWMTAAGNPDKVDKAKKLITQAVIGLIIILLAFTITNFVINALTGNGVFGGGGSGSGSDFSGRNGLVSVEARSSSLGQAGIDDHYPARGETDVARNTDIYITFEEAVDQSVISASTFLLYVSEDGVSESFTDAELTFTFSEDGETLLIDTPILGSATSDVQYTVELDDAIDADDGSDLIESGGYEWSFTVGTTLDLDPPTVKKVTPKSGGSYDRNIVVQITFDEAVDPSSASGTYGDGGNFDNIQVVTAAGEIVEGTYALSNEYKTVTFTSSEVCGTNSCGETITCLAGSEDLTVKVYAATPGSAPPQTDLYPYDGIVDQTGNALDGNGDGSAGDDYSWSFSTTNSINLTAPAISSISPEILGEDVDLDQKVLITFDSSMMSSTLTSDNILLESNPEHELWYSLTSSETDGDSTVVTIRHGVFLESSEEQNYSYSVSIEDGVQNEYQNCFYPADGPNGSGDTCGTTSSAPYCCNGTPSSSACSFF